jgi:hypothetical protein
MTSWLMAAAGVTGAPPLPVLVEFRELSSWLPYAIVAAAILLILFLARRVAKRPRQALDISKHISLKLEEAAGRDLQWSAKKDGCELGLGNQVLARLRLLESNVSGELEIIGEAAEGEWVLEMRRGLGGYHVAVRLGGESAQMKLLLADTSPNEVARFDARKLMFPDGRKFRWARTRLWPTEKAFKDDEGRPLVRFRKGTAQLRIEPSAASMPELPILVLLGCVLTRHV